MSDYPKTQIRHFPGGITEVSTPAMAPVDHYLSIPKLFLQRVKRDPKQVVIESKLSLGNEWQKITAKQFQDEVDSAARGLIGMGLQPGESIAIMAHTSYDWTLLDYAAWSAGAVSVPIYETSSLAQIEMILTEASVKFVFTENARLAEVVRAAARNTGLDCRVFSLDLGAITDLFEAGRKVAQEEVDKRLDDLTVDSLATIVYTSGTTGKPKGVQLTHGNFVSLTLNGLGWLPECSRSSRARLLLFLPLAHVYARFLQVFVMSGNGVLGHAPSIANLLPDIESFNPSYLLVVPRVLEKIYNSAEAKAGQGLKLRLFRSAAKVAIAYSKALDTAEGPSLALKAAQNFYSHIIYRKITGLLGARCEFAISGGAPLGDRLGHFYRGIGIQVLEGYGLTETSAPACVNVPRNPKVGTVGPPISSVSIRIDAQGELWFKGPSISPGYYHAPDLTAEAWEDGWFRTGDIGTVDSDGHVRITGRIKEILVTAGGKNVVPATLEDPLRGHPLISQITVVGEGRPFVGALITLDAEMLPIWLRNHNLPVMDVAAASRHKGVQDSLIRAIQRANKNVSRAESIRKFRVLTTDFTEANGMLTPSMKVKRARVLEQFADDIEKLYSNENYPGQSSVTAE